MTHIIDKEHVDIQESSREYIRLYFTADVPSAELSNAKVAFARGIDSPLSNEPDWFDATIEEDHVRFLFGQDIVLGKGIWTVYATFQANPEIPGYLRVS